MKSPNIDSRRRTAKEWSRIVAAWKKSGQPVAEFAASRDIAPRTLTWWKWRLAQLAAAKAPAAAEELRLIPVGLEPARSCEAEATPAWEVSTAGGHVLRFYHRISAAELAAVLEALAAEKGR